LSKGFPDFKILQLCQNLNEFIVEYHFDYGFIYKFILHDNLFSKIVFL